MKKIVVLLISISFLLLVGMGIVRFLESIYCRDLHEIIREGEAYGFTIGVDKATAFQHIATLFAQQHVRWVTVERKDSFLPIEDVAHEFADWDIWHIQGLVDPEIQKISLNFDSPTDVTFQLQSIRGDEIHGIGYYDRRFDVWPQQGAETARLRQGMSYEEVYTTLLALQEVQGFHNIRVRPKSYRDITVFTDEELSRLKKQDVWRVDMYPLPILYGMNYIRLTFHQGKLLEIERWKDAPDSLLNAILGI